MPEFLCNIWKVEHGNSAFILTPNSKKVAMDAGCSDSFSPSQYLNTEWNIDNIDALVVSHPHKDHIQDLPSMLQYIEIKSRFWNPYTPERLIYPSDRSNLREPLKSWDNMSKVFTETVPEDRSIKNSKFMGGVKFNFFCNKEHYLDGVAKENINNYSVLTTVKYKGLMIIFPGDLEPAGWDALLDNTSVGDNLDAQIKVLIAPHHGRKSGIRLSDGSIYKRFIDMLKPSLTIISDVWGNETTDPDAYRPFCSGLKVKCNDRIEINKVLTTKTNDCVSLKIEHDNLLVTRYR